ncbi:lysine decarboxylase-like protein [Aspergillus sclerotioniger CBS 115572]|uniref:Lysine decarboxylase-like protein n=1 Tax=Aspergillus sclerotioniger CBS 115572 TaxID=1450535 RepID=A0A317VEP6_9EURO|nr:lysine decarboxylase-like protein [Aspergillus sclerotioniger CBS 115572]PWY71547.1 lysine decarboxylase-like protein [Aspergillus sclerotioniger CBS 115572]
MSFENPQPAVVCVFCGSVSGTNPRHMEAARALAREFHKNNIHLVYGGGTIGLMGELARSLVRLSGPQAVHGIIPRALVKKEPGYDNAQEHPSSTSGVQQARAGKDAERIIPTSSNTKSNGTGMFTESEFGTTTIVADMHTRKRLMAEKVQEGGPGSGFVALAGGFGTIEEVMEMTTWNQLGIHGAGVVVVNVDGYWDGVLEWVKKAVQEGYIGEENGGILVEVKDVKEVWPRLRGYQVSNGRMRLNWGEE